CIHRMIMVCFFAPAENESFGGRLGLPLALATTTPASHGTGLLEPYRIAVLVPCFNEEAAIGKVVKDFRAALPAAAIFVVDNNSTDKTAEIARAAGAKVFE